jgi:hypothetical protein
MGTPPPCMHGGSPRVVRKGSALFFFILWVGLRPAPWRAPPTKAARGAQRPSKKNQKSGPWGPPLHAGGVPKGCSGGASDFLCTVTKSGWVLKKNILFFLPQLI